MPIYDLKKGYDFSVKQGWFHIEQPEKQLILFDDDIDWSEILIIFIITILKEGNKVLSV